MRFLFLLTLTATALAADWPEFLGPNRDNTSAETGLLAQWPAEGPAVVWKKEVGTGYSAPKLPIPPDAGCILAEGGRCPFA